MTTKRKDTIVLKTTGDLLYLHADVGMEGLLLLEQRLKALSQDIFWNAKPEAPLSSDHAELTEPAT